MQSYHKLKQKKTSGEVLVFCASQPQISCGFAKYLSKGVSHSDGFGTFPLAFMGVAAVSSSRFSPLLWICYPAIQLYSYEKQNNTF